MALWLKHGDNCAARMAPSSSWLETRIRNLNVNLNLNVSKATMETHDANLAMEATMKAAWQKIRDADAGKLNLDIVSSSAPTTADSLAIITEFDDEDDNDDEQADAGKFNLDRFSSSAATTADSLTLITEFDDDGDDDDDDDEQVEDEGWVQPAPKSIVVDVHGHRNPHLMPETSNFAQGNVVVSRPLMAPPSSGSPMWESRQRVMSM